MSWKLLWAVETKTKKNRVVPTFPAQVQALEAKTVRVQGFMRPLEPVVVEGKLAVLEKDPYGLYYRVTDAQPR